jgi:hypothetical protein
VRSFLPQFKIKLSDIIQDDARFKLIFKCRYRQSMFVRRIEGVIAHSTMRLKILCEKAFYGAQRVQERDTE